MLVADGLGAAIDDFAFDRQVWLAERSLDVAAGRIEPGTVAAMHAVHDRPGVRGGAWHQDLPRPAEILGRHVLRRGR